MGKLVRDGIPDIIKASGRQPETRVLDADEYLTSLFAKLLEEAEELRAAPKEHRLEEMADVYEVLRSLAVATGHSLEAVAQAADTKRQQRGGFMKRVWLEHW